MMMMMMHSPYVLATIAIIMQTVTGFVNINIRQSGTSPSQCEATCSSANETFTSCLQEGGPGPCICNDGFLGTLTNCFECAASIQGSTDFSSDQIQLDDIVSACDALGSPLQKVTLPGQNPNRVIATSAIANGTQTIASSSSIPSGGVSLSSSLSLTPSLPPTVTFPSSASLPTSTSPASNSSSSSVGSSSTNTTSNSAAAATSGSSSSTSSSTSSSATPSPTSGASTFKAIPGLSTVLVGAGLALLF